MYIMSDEQIDSIEDVIVNHFGVEVYGERQYEPIRQLRTINLHYTLFYYIDNANLDEDENEWIGQLRDKVDCIKSQAKYDMETV